MHDTQGPSLCSNLKSERNVWSYLHRLLLRAIVLFGLTAHLVLAQPLDGVMKSSTLPLGGLNGNLEVLGSHYKGLRSLSPGQSRMVIYSREDSAVSGGSSILVDGRYHASLIKGAYSDLCYRPGKVELAVRLAQVGMVPKDVPDSNIAVQLEGGRTHYLRLEVVSGRPTLQPVSPATAQQELPAKRLQLHTISRVAQECIEVPVEAVPVASLQHTFATDVLFAYARSDIKALTSEGKAAVDQLMESLSKNYVQIETLQITGHADPTGDISLNERLASQRAHTVRQYIHTTSQLHARVIAAGRGSRDVVVTGCGNAITPKVRACNQPNRRVVIEVTGTRR